MYCGANEMAGSKFCMACGRGLNPTSGLAKGCVTCLGDDMLPWGGTGYDQVVRCPRCGQPTEYVIDESFRPLGDELLLTLSLTRIFSLVAFVRQLGYQIVLSCVATRGLMKLRKAGETRGDRAGLFGAISDINQFGTNRN